MASAAPTISPVEYQTQNAYHGTKLDDAKGVWADKKFRVPTPKPAHLENRFGPGYYFWENTKSAAHRWARNFYRVDEIGIIRASIDCKKLLDLLTQEHYIAFERVQSMLAYERKIPVKDMNHAAVLSFLHAAKIIDGTRLIAGVSPQTKVHQGSKLAGPFDVMLCIYEPMNIVVTSIEDSSSS